MDQDNCSGLNEEIDIEKRKTVSLSIKVEVLTRNALCEECLCSLSDGSGEYDHIIALELGGEHKASNIQILCKKCHKEKTKNDVFLIRQAARRRSKIQTGRSTKRKTKKIQNRKFNTNLKKKMSGKVINAKKEEE